jgi:hypothetical protein
MVLGGPRLVARQPAMDLPSSDRRAGPFAVEIGPETLPSRRSRLKSLAAMAAMIIAVGAVTALGIAVTGALVWVIVSAAVT